MEKKKQKSKHAVIDESKITGNIYERTVEEVMHSSMLPYSEFVILDRALPRVEDGLKPVQRRILYTMRELALTPDKPYKKSARVVGDCLGKYHPHGDRSVYDAMVRMAQEFNMSNILVQGHGNFGSIDGDSAAAMRYTEVRLSELALELMRDLEKETVSYSLNFDDSLKEPDYFPGRYPNLLVNGASGIAVGLATNIPPHNLGEVIDAVVAYIDEPNCNLATLLKYIKGPDFPTGGIILKSEEMIDAYATGKGRVQVRAKFFTEEIENGKTNIVITALPFQTNKAEFLQSIVGVKEKYKGALNFISEIQDESDKRGMRAVITLKKDADIESIISLLLKHTQMQTAFNYNIVAIAGGKPKLLSLMDIIQYYVNFQIDIVNKRARFDLTRAKERAHIVEGLMIAIQNIDEVIRIIKSSSSVQNAKNALMERFKLSDAQATAILDMRLSRLTNLETTKLADELAELRKLIIELEKLLASKALQLNLIKKELMEIKEKYPSPRRTEVVREFENFVTTPIEKMIENTESLLAVSYDGLRLKNINLKNVKDIENTFAAINNINILHRDSLRVHNFDNLLIFTNMGNVFKLRVADVESCKNTAKGVPLLQMIKCDAKEKIVNIFNLNEINSTAELIFFTKLGYIRKCPLNEYNISKSTASAIKLKTGDEVVKVEENYYLPAALIVTKAGLAINCELGTVPMQKRASSGVIGISLNEKDEVLWAGQASSSEKMLLLTDDNKAKRLNINEIPISARNRKGLNVTFGTQKLVLVVAPVMGGELVIATKGGETIVADVNKIDVTKRTKPFNLVPKLGKDAVISLAKIYLV